MSSGGALIRRAVLVAIAFAALVAAGPAHATFPGQNGKLIFWEYQSGYAQIATVNGDGTQRTTLTSGPADHFDPAFSPDGTRIAFSQWTFPDGPSKLIEVMNADGTGVAPLPGGEGGFSPAWSPNGDKIAFVREVGGSGSCIEIVVVDIATEQSTVPVPANEGPCTKVHLDWSPDGTRFAFDSSGDFTSQIYTIHIDGSQLAQLTTNGGAYPSWAPDRDQIAFTSLSINTINGDGSGLRGSAQGDPGGPSIWSPDGAMIAWSAHVMNDDFMDVRPFGAYPDPLDWQPIPPPKPQPGYPRPKGATPFMTYLVPAYEPCGSPNSTHGPPLAFGSCSPPTMSSSTLTVGTPDANGAPPKSVGSVRFTVVNGNPSTPEDEADVMIAGKLTDVRCTGTDWFCSAGPLSDYTSSLLGIYSTRITDRYNGSIGTRPGTLDIFRTEFDIPCTPTADDTVGSTCEVATSMDAIVSGSVKEGKRTIWQLSQIQVLDGAPDRTPIAKQGIFVP